MVRKKRISTNQVIITLYWEKKIHISGFYFLLYEGTRIRRKNYYQSFNTLPVFFGIFTYVLKTRQGSGLKSNFMNDSHWRNHPLHQKRWKLMKHWKSMLQKRERCHQAMRWDGQKYSPCLGVGIIFCWHSCIAIGQGSTFNQPCTDDNKAVI